jgi:hypothetical protein
MHAHRHACAAPWVCALQPCAHVELTLVVACLQERLLVERSGRTFFETGGVMGTLRELSKSFLGPRPPLQSLRCAPGLMSFRAGLLLYWFPACSAVLVPRAATWCLNCMPGASHRIGCLTLTTLAWQMLTRLFVPCPCRLSAMGPDAGEDKLFTPRYADGPRGGGPKASPSPRGTPRRRGSDADFFDSVEDEQGIGAGEGGRGGLRHRPGHGPAGMGPGGRGGGGGGGGRGTPRGASHSRRAIVPVDDDLL